MPIPKKLEKKINENEVKHDVIEHRKVFTAYDAAQTMKKKLDQIAKSLLVKSGGQFYLVHVPADKNIDLKKLAKALGVKKVEIPKENSMLKKLKIKPGKMAAFGFMYKVPDVVDKKLAKAKKIVFSAGALTESIEMSIKEFKKLTDEYIEGVFTVAKKLPKANKGKSKKKKTTKKKKSKKSATKKKTSKKKKK